MVLFVSCDYQALFGRGIVCCTSYTGQCLCRGMVVLFCWAVRSEQMRRISAASSYRLSLEAMRCSRSVSPFDSITAASCFQESV